MLLAMYFTAKTKSEHKRLISTSNDGPPNAEAVVGNSAEDLPDGEDEEFDPVSDMFSLLKLVVSIYIVVDFILL